MSVVAVGTVAVGAGAAAYTASQSGKTGTQSTLNWQQKQLMQKLYMELKGKVGKTGAAGATPYGGQQIAALDPMYGKVRQSILDFNSQSLRSNQSTALTSLLSGKPSYQVKLDPQSTAKWFDQGVAQPAWHTFQTRVMPKINESFAGVGAFGSRQGEATRTALSDLQNQLSGQLGQAQMSNQVTQEQMNAQLSDSAANRQMQAVPMADQYRQAPLSDAIAMTGAIQPFQEHAQQEALAKFQEFLRMAPENSPWLKTAMSFIGEPMQAFTTPKNPGQSFVDYSTAAANVLGAFKKQPGATNNSGITQGPTQISRNDRVLAPGSNPGDTP